MPEDSTKESASHSCLRTGALVLTAIAVVGGPREFALYRLDKGVCDAVTACEIGWMT